MKSSKNFFFILLFLSCFQIFISPISPVNAETYLVGRGEMFASNLYFDFQTGESNVIREIGNKRLSGKKMVDLGTEDLGNGLTLFKANLYMTVESNIWTAYTANTVFPYAKSESRSTTWLDLYTHPDPLLVNLNHANNHKTFVATYEDYHLSTMKAKGIDKTITITANFNEVTVNDMNYGDVTGTTEKWSATIVEMNMVKADSSIIGSYDDHYTSNDFKGLTVTDTNEGRPSSDSSLDDPKLITDAISKLGVSISNKGKETIQQGLRTITKGVMNRNQFTIKMIPEVYKNMDKVTTTYRSLAIDTNTGLFGLSPAGIYKGYDGNFVYWTKSTVQTDKYRCRGWGVTNYNYHLEWEIEVYIESYVQLEYNDASDNEDIIEEQGDSQLSDYYWVVEDGGEVGVDVDVDTSIKGANLLAFLKILPFIVIGIVVLAFFVLFFTDVGYTICQFVPPLKIVRDIINPKKRK